MNDDTISIITTVDWRADSARLQINLKPLDQRDDRIPAIQQRLQQQVSDGLAMWNQQASGITNTQRKALGIRLKGLIQHTANPETRETLPDKRQRGCLIGLETASKISQSDVIDLQDSSGEFSPLSCPTLARFVQ